MKTILYLIILVLFASTSFAKKVEVLTAQKAAKNLYYQRINQIKDVKLSDINLTLVYTQTVNAEPVYYIFNVNNTEGFVILSANDIAKPCIGYGFEGAFNVNNMPPEFQYFMGKFSDEISTAVDQRVATSEETTKEWANILSTEPVVLKTKSIQPLLLTTWNQDTYYNELCPADAGGVGGHVYVGCVALSMSQVMKYWNYPTTGQGSHTSYIYSNGGYPTTTVNFANQTYTWENMPNAASGSNLELAKMLYHCGVAVDMNYGIDGSGTQTSYIPNALKNYFKYNTACSFKYKTSYTQTAWENLLRTQIDNKHPMVYQGMDATSGHAWNCDGYNATEFHMNWGWGGSANGFFSVSGPITAGGYTFDQSFAAVIDIYPNANYPTWCTPTAKMITGAEGTFNDGSGNQNYLDNRDCLYLIQPPCASYVNLSFDRFDLATGDMVKVYDGATTSDSLIGTFDASNIPTTSYASTGPNMLVEFITDGSANATGWYASYDTYPCQGSKILTNPTGTIFDGSQNCDYANSLTCLWYIQPVGATSFQLDFTEFGFAAGDAGDYLKIYKNATFPATNLIGTYNALNIPTTLNIVGTKVILRFSTNSSAASNGWLLNYTTTLTGMDNNLSEFNAGVFPNPFSNDATISYSLTDLTKVKIVVSNVLGEVIGTYNKQEVQGNYNLPLSSFTNNLSQGIYFVNLNFNDKATLIKIVCTK